MEKTAVGRNFIFTPALRKSVRIASIDEHSNVESYMCSCGRHFVTSYCLGAPGRLMSEMFLCGKANTTENL